MIRVNPAAPREGAGGANRSSGNRSRGERGGGERTEGGYGDGGNRWWVAKKKTPWLA